MIETLLSNNNKNFSPLDYQRPHLAQDGALEGVELESIHAGALAAVLELGEAHESERRALLWVRLQEGEDAGLQLDLDS